MANELVIGKLRAILGLDTAQYEAGARKAAAVNKKLSAEMKAAQDEIKKFVAGQQQSTKVFQNLVVGMSAAGKAASSSAQLIRGMGQAGREAAAGQLKLAESLKSTAAAWAAARRGDAERVAAFQAASTSAKTLSQSVSSVVGPLAAMGAALAAGAVLNFAKQVGSFAGQMTDLSAETGIGIERLQAFNFVATGVGLTIEDLARAVNQLTIRAVGGDPSAVGALDRLGINLQKFVALSADDRLLEVADAMGKVASATERTTIAADLFGTKIGPRALRFLNSELRHTIEELEKSGVVIDEELIKKADRFDDLWSQSWIHFRALAITALDGVMGHWRKLDALVSGGAFATVIDSLRAISAAMGHQAEIEAIKKAAPGNPLGVPEPARARMPGEADLNELDRRVEDRARKNQEAQRAAQEAAQKTAQAAEAAARAYEDAQERARRAAQDVRSAEEAIALQKIEEAAESYKLMVEVIQDLAVEASKTDAILDKLGDDAAKSASDAANEMGLAWMEADKAVMDAEKERGKEMVELWHRIADDMTFAITDGFAMMLTGMRSFKDSMIGIWQEIRRVIAGILSKMLADFIGGYVRKAVAMMAGVAVANATVGMGAAAANSSVAGLLAGNAAIAGATGGGGAGIGATLTALATNPFTWAAAAGIGLGLLVGKGGLFRGGEEGTQVNPRRDRFFAQFGPTGTGPGSGFSNLASFLHSPSLFGALSGADTVREWESAQSAVINRLGMLGHKGVRAFNMGGFVPPGVTQPAILHGGARGEVVMPLDKMGPTHVTNHFTIQGWDGADILRVVEGKVIPLLNNASQRNTGNYATEHRKGFGIRPAYGTR